MKHPCITITGSILAADVLNAIEQNDGMPGQNDKDFGLPKGEKAKDLIARVYADARFYWQGFKMQMARLDEKEGDLGTSETRKFWIIPFLTMLGYDPVYAQQAARVQEKAYPISHRDMDLDEFPIHIVSYKDSLDRKVKSHTRMSPHAMLQEYLNLTEHLYGIVTNGLRLRLLRDSSRLVKLSYLEFDLERIFEEEHYADFALLYRLLHQSRMPRSQDRIADCLMEEYHQRALASGSRIRDGLSKAVKDSIFALANGFLQHPKNTALRQQIASGAIPVADFYNWQLRLVYRMLFLMVIEERGLVYAKDSPPDKRRIYFDYYSLQRLRELSEHRFLADARYQDYWQSLRQTFRLFQSEAHGQPLGLKPLAGGLFGYEAIGQLNESSLDNAVLLKVLRALNVFLHPDTGQKIRVNYGALNVEEFGSVYEELLEFDPVIEPGAAGRYSFKLKKGEGRSSSGSHYTPDELVAPLIEHSLDHLIQKKLRQAGWTSGTTDPEKRAKAERGLLSLTVCDVACGSGHILLNAARRIAQFLALVQTGDEQPSPEAQRSAIRQVIRRCIYGVDLNPLAVELCKVALWLEAHNPGEPLNFLDHHIKCGNAIVGAGRLEDLLDGIPDEAFKSLSGFGKEEKEVLSVARKANKKERKDRIQRKQLTTAAMQQTEDTVKKIAQRLQEWAGLPEDSPAEIEEKARAYRALTNTPSWYRLKQLADVQAAQFFVPKRQASDLVTDRDFYTWLNRSNAIQDHRAALAVAEAERRRFFHWFLEFPEVFAKGGFDCILGNPPFLGGQRITGAYGHDYANYIQHRFAPIGSVDLVTYFFRRNYEIIRKAGFLSLISTNTIAQGDAREGGLGVIFEQGGTINHAVRSMRWPGTAAVEVSLVTIFKGAWEKALVLNRKEVEQITTYLDDQEYLGEPYKLKANENKSFQGSIVLGKGFVLEPEEAQALIDKNPDNEDVLFPYLNGQDLNNNVDQSPSRWVINFFDWPERRYTEDEWAALDKGEKKKIRDRIADERMVPIAPPDYKWEVAMDYPDCYQILQERVKPERTRWKTDKKGNEIVGTYALRKPLPTYWWVYGEKRPALYRTIAPLERVMVISAQATKFPLFSLIPSNIVYSHALVVISSDSYFGILNCSLYNEWCFKYASLLESRLRYAPSDLFEPFPLPSEGNYIFISKEYLLFRSKLMENIQLGLTKTYNQFHNPQLTAEVADLPQADFQKQYGKETWNLYNHLEKKQAGRVRYAEAVPMIEELRRLHQEMDEAVLAAYGWHEDSARWGKAIALRHDFYEVDYLPENDNIRFTIHPDARKEVLKRLLLLNHERYAEEVREGLHGEDAELPPGYEEEDQVSKVKGAKVKGGKVEEPKGKYKRTGDTGQGELF
jgi:hypothetical protein